MGQDVDTAVRQVLGDRCIELDRIILDYIINVLQDDTFEFGLEGEGTLEALGPLLVASKLATDPEEAKNICESLNERLSERVSRAAVRERGVRKLQTSVRMQDDGGGGAGGAGWSWLGPGVPRGGVAGGGMPPMPGMRPEFYGLPPGGGLMMAGVSDRDLQKMERKKRKEERQRLLDYQAHLEAAAAAASAMPAVVVQRNAGGGGPRDIHLHNFSVVVQGRELISGASITLTFGRRYGLVGRNGTGKTTLLKALAMHSIEGIPPNCQILHVEQEVAGDTQSVLECVLETDTERTSLLREEAELAVIAKAADPPAATSPPGDASAANGTNGVAPAGKPEATRAGGKARGAGAAGAPGRKGAEAVAVEEAAPPLTSEEASTRLADIYKRLEEIDAYSAEARASTILAGLSFTPDMIRRPTKTFSGGWRMRVALARALFVEPDLLLLDEPTNHLDLHAVLWLENYLLKWSKTLVVVSHARGFLNAVCTDTIHLHNQKLTAYKGDYDTYEKTRDERLRNQMKAHESNEDKRKHIQAFIDKFRYNAKRASLVQSRIKALEKMEKIDAIVNDPDYCFEFPSPEDKPPPPIIAFSDVSFGYPGGPLLFKNLNFGIDLDSRLAMVGPNGIGKSTLLKLISGELEPTTGQVFRSPKVRMATFSQHHVEGMDLSLTPLAFMVKCFPGVPEQKVRGHLGSFGVSGNLALQPMYTLSGGQKSRVAFARITFIKPHILLLDEPSNHLDLDAVEALIQGLALYAGGVLMVSHDEHLIAGSVEELWVVSNGKATPFHSTFADYKKTLKPT